MRDRLIEILREPIPVISGYVTVGESRMYVADAERYADRLIENGVIVPPCKVGDTVYHLTSIDTHDELGVAEIFEGKVCSISKDKIALWISCRYYNGLYYSYTEMDIGRKLFLTREEAEQALKGGDT